jgi:hypothetical protein
MNPVENGDMYLVPLNMIPAEMAGKEPEPALKPEPEANARVAGLENITTLHERLFSCFLPVFSAAAQRVVNRENIALKRQFDKQKRVKDDEALEKYLSDFYLEFPEHIKREFQPAVEALYNATYDGLFPGVEQTSKDIAAETEFIERYLENISQNHVNFSYRTIQDSKNDIGNLLDMLKGWESTRANEIAEASITICVKETVAAIIAG